MDSSEHSCGQSGPIPIAQINPAVDQLAERSIRATVTLVWPYSSSTKSFSVLLAEPDVRLRRSNGQVKVTFHALVAERIAETDVGIGDEVVLGLSGCRLEGNGTATQTPSRYVAWDVHFDNRVHIEISRASQHHATVKIDPPPEPVNEPPVTPVPSRKRPEDIETAPSFGAWTSPAFFQRSHASFGGLVDSSVDPFAEEEDGFIPGKGRKRPRFSMRSSEWRVVDEPASPGEKASPVDWTEELEAEVDEDESAAENIEIPQKSPEPTSVLPDTQENLDSTGFGYSATSTGQLAPETGPTREEPVEPLTPTPASYVNGKEDLANSLQIPISSPHLRPVPSPGLPVPSPFASSTPGNGYLISDLAPTTQPSTTVSQSHEVIGDSGVPKVQTETVHVDTEDSNLKTESVTSFPGHTAPVEPQLQTASKITEQVPEDVHSEEEDDDDDEEEEEEEEEAVAVPGDALSPSPDRESPVKDIPHMGVPDDHSDDVEMVDENEDEDEYLEDEMEQAAEHEPTLSVERSQENPESEDEETAESPVEAQEPAADHHEPEEISEEDEDDQEDEDMNEAESDEYESESGYEDREEDIVDSEMESDEDEDEIPREVPTQAPPSNTQPDVIVLDSDDEDEPPVVAQIQQPQHERESEDVEQHAISPAEDRGDWPSDEENEMGDETMAERQSDAKVNESEDGYAQDERVEEVDEDEDEDEEGDEEEELDEEEEYEDEGDEDEEEEEEKEASAAEGRQRNGFPGEQPEQISLLDDDETEKSEDEHAQDAHVEEDVDEKEEYEANSPEDDQRVEDREEEDLTAYAQTEAQAEVDTVEYDTNKDEDKGQDQGNVSEGNIQGPEILEHGHTGQDEDARTIVVEQAEGHSDRQEVELVDRTSRAEDKPDKDRPDEEKPDESDADSQDEFVESSEFLAAPEVPPLAVDPTLKPLKPEQQLESNAAMIYDGAPSPPGAWYDAPTDLDESASELQDDEANGPSQQLAAEHEQQLHAVAEARGNTPAIEITGTPEAQPRPRSHSIKQEEKDDRSYTGLRSKYSYFAPLATLADHFNTLTDTISVIHDFSPITQAQAGPRDHILTLHLTDPSMAGTTLLAHLARPYPEALPQHPREGDAILLRNFKPKPFNRAMSLVSDDTSAWAVFPDDDANNELVPGPPVEYGVEERSYASGLRQWYRDDGGAALVADVSLQTSLNYDHDHDQDQNQDQDLSITSLSPTPSSNASISDSSDLDNLDTLDAQNLGLGLTSGGLLAHRSLLRHGRRRHRDSPRRGRRRITIHELRDGRRYTEVGSPSDRESIHELRDGTVYANL